MKLQIIVNGTFEDERALIDVSAKTPKLIYKGDYYHDKIDEFIEGYLFCLDYNKITYTKLDEIVVLPNEKDTYFDEFIVDKELFKLCDFYEEDEC